MSAANIWRGERVIRARLADGNYLTSTLGATHDNLSRAMGALSVTSLQELRSALMSLDATRMKTFAACCDVVDGNPADVILAAPGAQGLDAIADALIGLLMGQTEEEQMLEKKLFVQNQEAQQAALLQSAIEPMIGQIAQAVAGLEKARSTA